MIRFLCFLLCTLLPIAASAADVSDNGIVMLGEMKAKPGQGRTLYERMQKEIPPLDKTKGLELYEVLRSDTDPDKIVIIEIWDSAAHHQAAVNAISPDAIKEVMALLAIPPTGETFKR